jgi:hypothetical protein
VSIKLFPDLTIAAQNIRSIPIVMNLQDSRKCHFEDELSLDHYQRYSQENCRRECVAKKVNNLQTKMTITIIAMCGNVGIIAMCGKMKTQLIQAVGIFLVEGRDTVIL